MTNSSYFPNYFSIEDILITQCKIRSRQTSNVPTGPPDLEETESKNEKTLPLWYFNEMKSSTTYFTPELPDMYENVYKAVCEADYTNINLGTLHPEFYEFGRYLIPFDNTNLIGRILFQTLCHRVQHLLDSSKTIFRVSNTQSKMDRLENHLLDTGTKTYKLFLDWYQFNFSKIESSQIIVDHKRKREAIDDVVPVAKRIYGS